MNGRVTRACLVTAGEVSGRDILTVEGLGAPGALDPVQRAFVEAGAVQCGFCTPGLLMADATLGADRDGRVTGLRMEMLADGGAYASAGTAIIVRAAVSGCGPVGLRALTRSVSPSTVTS